MGTNVLSEVRIFQDSITSLVYGNDLLKNNRFPPLNKILITSLTLNMNVFILGKWGI